MKQKLLLTLIAFAVILPIPALARDFTYEYEGQTLTYTVLDEEAKTCETKAGTVYGAGNKISGQLSIPDIVEDESGNKYTVTTIGSYSFNGCNEITGNLVIPESVANIGEGAFFMCSGFTGSLTIPNSVTSIKPAAFSGCTGFNGSLTIGNSVITIGHDAFSGCSGFKGDLIMPESVNAIGMGAFQGCEGFKGVYISSLESWCNIDFEYCTSNPLYDIHNLYLNDELIKDLVIPESISEIKKYAFYNGSGFTGSLTISDGVTSIGEEAFYECTGFSGSLTIGTSVTTIGGSAFYNCGFTGDLIIPESVTTIEWGTFEGCSGFNGSLTIPNSVTTIGNGAFYNCSFSCVISLNPVPPIIEKIELGAPFEQSYCEKTPLIVPDGSEEAYSSSPVWEWFQSIKGLESAGIEGVEADGERAVRVEGGNIIAPEGSEVFDLNGRRVSVTDLCPGIYIVRIPGSKAVKIRL